MTVNWEEQWRLFAPNYHEGYAHVDLKGEKTLRLKAGPGFGDFSHPTTRLVLTFLEHSIFPDAVVLDLGCGSGILTFAASLLGAKNGYGVDIEEEALEHARLNQKANGVKNIRFRRKLPKTFCPDIILMNMILSEQKQAWTYSFPAAQIITSGVLSSQRESYLELASSWGFQLIAEKEEDGWLGFLFHS